MVQGDRARGVSLRSYFGTTRFIAMIALIVSLEFLAKSPPLAISFSASAF